MQISIPVYSEQTLTPRASQVIRSIVDYSYPQHEITFRAYKRGDKQALVFGRAPEEPTVGTSYVYTYSIAQILSKANAASVVTAGIRRFIDEPDPIPFSTPVGTPHLHVFTDQDWNYDAPTVIDIETNGNLKTLHTADEVELISIAIYQAGRPPWVLHGAWKLFGTEGYTAKINRAFYTDLARFLLKFTKAIYHNGKFDTRVLNRVLSVDLSVWFDTMLAHHVLNQAAGDHKLKTLARRYCGAPEWEANLSKYTKGGGHYEYIPTRELIQYNGWDVYWTYKLYEFLYPQIEADEEAEKAFYFEMEAAKFLLTVEQYGIPFDIDYAEELAMKKEAEAKIHLALMRSWLIDSDDFDSGGFNPNSPKQVMEALAQYGQYPPKTDEKTLVKIIEDNENRPVAKFCTTLLTYRKAMKVVGTYARGWSSRSRHGRVHPTFLVHGTSTGRLSSTNPNAQNVPREKEIRRMVKTHG